MYRTAGVALATTALLAASAATEAGVAAAGGAAHAAACGTKTVTSQNAGGHITLAPCQRLKISLTEASDGGYQWSIVKPPPAAVLKLVSNTSVAPPQTNPPTAGANSTRVVVYRAVGAGRATLKLAEARSFQKGSTISTFSLQVTVTGTQ